MTVFELGAVGEFVGAILLFVSLIYVGVQVRQNTKTSRAESRRSSVDQYTNMDLTIMGNPELRAVVVAMIEGASMADLDVHQTVTSNAVLQAYFNSFRRDFDERKSDPAQWRQLEMTFKSNLVPSVLVREWWKVRGEGDSVYGGEFHDWVSTEIDEDERTAEGDA